MFNIFATPGSPFSILGSIWITLKTHSPDVLLGVAEETKTCSWYLMWLIKTAGIIQFSTLPIRVCLKLFFPLYQKLLFWDILTIPRNTQISYILGYISLYPQVWCIDDVSFSFIKITILGTTKTQQIHSSISNLMIYSYKYPSFPSISPLFILRFPYKWLIVPGFWRRSAPEPALASPLRHATGRPGGRHGPLCAVPPGRCHDLSELQGHVGRPPAADRGALETGRFFFVKPVGIFMALWGGIEWDLVPSKRRILKSC